MAARRPASRAALIHAQQVNIDTLLGCADRALRTVFAPATSGRAVPGEDLPEAQLTDAQREHARLDLGQIREM